jgi:23S rRNA (pseudouridine1915-N3)-methyltransferase
VKITILSVGKKNDPLSAAAIEEYEKRLKQSFAIQWIFVPYSGHSGDEARRDESAKIRVHLKSNETVWLLDETGVQLTSPELSEKIETLKNGSTKDLFIIIGGAYGVDKTIKDRADFTWSLSKLVFPHLLVRLILVEQLYRAHEIARGSGYHHV